MPEATGSYQVTLARLTCQMVLPPGRRITYRAAGWRRGLLESGQAGEQPDHTSLGFYADGEDERHAVYAVDANELHSRYEASLVLCRLLAMEDGFVPKKYDQEIKARAVRMVRDHLPTYGSVTRAADAVGPQLGISGNTLRRWVVQADVDDGVREGVPSEVQAELVRLTAENKRLRETNEILRRASIFFAGELDPRAR